MTPTSGIAQAGIPSVTDIQVRDGANPGEVVISWDAVPQAARYRVGYVNMEVDYHLAKATCTEEWIDAFVFVDVNARNIPVNNGRAEYTIRRLVPGARHAFTVLTSNYFVDTGGGGIVTSEFFWPSNPRWRFLDGRDSLPPGITLPTGECTETPAGSAPPGHGELCPITGLPMPAGGYLGVGDRATFHEKYSITMDRVTFPETLTRTRADGTEYDDAAPTGRRWLFIYLHHSNRFDFTVYVDPGRDYILGTDAGSAFSWTGDIELEPGSSRGIWLLFDIPQNATTAVLAMRPLTRGSENADNAPQLFRIPIPEPAAATIVFGDLNWHSALVQNRIAQYIVEKGYGHPTDTRFGATLSLIQGLRSGETDVLMELWLPNQQEAWVQATSTGDVVSLGENYRDWQSAFVIPAYLQAQYPGLDSVEDLKDPQYRRLFATAETGDKARLVSCVIGWACEIVNAEQIEGYGLSDHVEIINPGDGAALNADLYGAYERREPWLGYQWGTNDPALLLDLVQLAEPAYSDACWRTTRACAYEDATILIAANHNLPEIAPDVAVMPREWDFIPDTAYREIARWRAFNPGADVNATALWFLNNRANIWEQWATDEAATSIRAALAAGESADGWPDS